MTETPTAAQPNPPAAAQTARTGNRAVAMATDFFSSIKLAVILLILLAAVSIIGTILFQGESAQDNIRLFTEMVWGLVTKTGLVDATSRESVMRWQGAAQRWGLALYSFSHKIALDDLYHTWYFNLLLLLLALNLIVCSLRHWPHTWHFFSQPKLTLEGEGAAGIPLRRQLTSTGDAERVAAAAADYLRSRGYRTVRTAADGALHVFGQKGIWGRLGIYVVHLSVLVILLGAVLGFQFGRRGSIAILEGTFNNTVRLRGGGGDWPLPFALRNDDFELSYYEKKLQPKDYKSKLVVLEGNREVARKTIEVNAPLIHQGIYFYQSSYGDTSKLVLQAVGANGFRNYYNLDTRGSEELPEFNMHVEILQYVPDFAVDPANEEIYSASSEPRNPAVLLQAETHDGRQFVNWLVLNDPSHNLMGDRDVRLSLAEFRRGPEYTVLSVSYDPGTWVVWVGCCLMIIGVFVAFFVPHKRVWVKVAGGGGRGPVWAAGSTNRNRSTFEDEFAQTADGLKEKLAS